MIETEPMQRLKTKPTQYTVGAFFEISISTFDAFFSKYLSNGKGD